MAQFKSKHTGEKIDEGVDKAGGAVPLIHDAGGVRTLRDMAMSHFSSEGTIQIEMPTYHHNSPSFVKLVGACYSNAYPVMRGTFELQLGGHDWLGGWHGTNATLTAKNKMFTKVRYGFNEQKQKRVILITPAAKSDAGSLVVQTAVIANAIVPYEGWSVGVIPDESGITNIVETPVSWVAADDGVWYDMVLQNGATAGYGLIPQYRKVGNIVHLRGYINTNNADSNVMLSLLPAGFRPGYNQNIPISVPRMQTGDSVFRTMIVNSNGGIQFNKPIDIPMLDISSSFIAEQ